MGPRGGRVEWPVRSGVMPAIADGFSARTETAADLAAALVAGAIVVLVPVRVAGESPGGWLESCGKTQLAVTVAESMWATGRLDLLVWVTASNRASVLSAYAEAAVAATGAGPDGDGQAAAERFTGWLSRTRRPWLVILDDLRDMADLAGLWPEGPAGRVLITAADPAAVPGDRGALIHPVGVFTPQQALNVLASRRVAGPGGCAEELAAELGYEPLAITQAGAVMAGSELSCPGYRERFGRERAAAADKARRSPPAASITWLISAGYAERLSAGTRPMLTLAALLDGHGIPAGVLTSPAVCAYLAGDEGPEPASPARPRHALLAAERAGLLSTGRAGTETTIQMNRAVQAGVRAAAEGAALDRAAAAAADALLQAWPDDDKPAWLAHSLRSCTASLREVTGDLLWADGCHPVILRAGESLDRAHLASVSVRYWSDIAEVSARILGEGHPDTMTARERVAAASLAAGQPEEAVSWFECVLTERVRLLGPDHPTAIAARRDVGHALVAAQRPGEAVTVLNRVVSDCERVRGNDNPETLAAREELAAALHADGRFSNASEVLRQTVTSRERLHGRHHEDTERTRQRLADAYLADGKIKPALSLYRQVLADRERILGPDHLSTIGVRATLGSAYYSAGRMASALQFREAARDGYERAVGADHPDTLASSADLACTYYAVGRLTDALALSRDTLARCERALPPHDPLTQAVRQNLASMSGE